MYEFVKIYLGSTGLPGTPGTPGWYFITYLCNFFYISFHIINEMEIIA